jgi:hypothetical protein
MGQPEDKENVEQLSEEADGQQETKANVFVDSTALVSNGHVVPIYGVLESQKQKLIYAWLWILGTAVYCAWMVSFIYAVLIDKNPIPHYYNFSSQTTIRLVNVASQVSILLIGGLVGVIFDALSWALACRPNGVSIKSFITTKSNTSLFNVGMLFLTFGTHQKWSVLRFSIAALAWLVGLLPLSTITTGDVYYPTDNFPVVAGIAPFHDAVTAINATIQQSDLNYILLGMTENILTDPSMVVDVDPLYCESNCTSIFLPGGLELVRRPDASTLYSKGHLEEPVIIVQNAPGYQLEFSPTNYAFNYNMDCNNYGTDWSSLYVCLAFDDNAQSFMSGFAMCPFELMGEGSCLSDTSWTQQLNASVSMSLYQRYATVAYDASNFSILSIEKLGPWVNATNELLVSDFQSIFETMYPSLKTIVLTLLGGALDGIFGDTGKLKSDLWDILSAFSVQAGFSADLWLLQKGFPTWTSGPINILEGILTVPIPFVTLLWQFSDFPSLPSNLTATASPAQVAYRARAAPWTIILFAVVIIGFILWSIFCLLCVHVMIRRETERQLSPALANAFESSDLFDVQIPGIWDHLLRCLRWGSRKTSPASERTAGTGLEAQVVAPTLANNVKIVVDRSETLS